MTWREPITWFHFLSIKTTNTIEVYIFVARQTLEWRKQNRGKWFPEIMKMIFLFIMKYLNCLTAVSESILLTRSYAERLPNIVIKYKRFRKIWKSVITLLAASVCSKSEFFWSIIDRSNLLHSQIPISFSKYAESFESLHDWVCKLD